MINNLYISVITFYFKLIPDANRSIFPNVWSNKFIHSLNMLHSFISFINLSLNIYISVVITFQTTPFNTLRLICLQNLLQKTSVNVNSLNAETQKRWSRVCINKPGGRRWCPELCIIIVRVRNDSNLKL